MTVAAWPGYGRHWWCLECGSTDCLRGKCACGSKMVYHSGVQVYGPVELGEGVALAAPSEVNATGSLVKIGSGCDLAAFVVLNVADSSDRCIGRSAEIRRAPIVLGESVFVGSHCFIGGGVTIGHHSKIGAGVVLVGELEIPPYSLVSRAPGEVRIREGYYAA